MSKLVGNFHIAVPCWVLLLVIVVAAFVAAIPSDALGAYGWIRDGLLTSTTAAAAVMVASPNVPPPTPPTDAKEPPAEVTR